MAARAGVLAAIAGVLAVPAGLLPVWGLLFTAQAPIVVPIPEVLAALAVLPLSAVLGAALLSRPISPWSAYRSRPQDQDVRVTESEGQSRRSKRPMSGAVPE